MRYVRLAERLNETLRLVNTYLQLRIEEVKTNLSARQLADLTKITNIDEVIKDCDQASPIN